jgi:FixJ family two-component response regulator
MLAECGRIVIIEDDPGMGLAIERLCHAADLPSSRFSSAEDYLESGDLARTAGLVLDIQLPGMSGFQLDDWLKQQNHRVPTVFITGSDNDSFRQLALSSGALALLHKPFQSADLLELVRSFFNQT